MCSMKLDRFEARRVIRANNLLWRCTFYDELITLPSYELCYVLNTDIHFMNCAMNFGIFSLDVFESELDRIESFFRIRRKECGLYLSEFDTPEGIQELLTDRGYAEIKEEEGVFWGLEPSALKSMQQSPSGLKIRECRTTNDLAQYLIAAKEGYNDFDYTPYAASMSKLFNSNIDGVSQFHFVGMMDGRPVASGTIGVFFDMAIWINAAVIPEYRKRGINTAMMAYAIGVASEFGATKFFFSTDVDNIDSIKSGTNIGFTEVIRQRMFTKSGS